MIITVFLCSAGVPSAVAAQSRRDILTRTSLQRELVQSHGVILRRFSAEGFRVHRLEPRARNPSLITWRQTPSPIRGAQLASFRLSFAQPRSRGRLGLRMRRKLIRR